MTIQYEQKTARLIDFVSIEEAEGLLEWLQTQTQGQLNLAACTHLHAANLQVLMAAKPEITAWPEKTEFALWIKSALDLQHSPPGE